jgi:hypothetical protein
MARPRYWVPDQYSRYLWHDSDTIWVSGDISTSILSLCESRPRSTISVLLLSENSSVFTSNSCPLHQLKLHFIVCCIVQNDNAVPGTTFAVHPVAVSSIQLVPEVGRISSGDRERQSAISYRLVVLQPSSTIFN